MPKNALGNSIRSKVVVLFFLYDIPLERCFYLFVRCELSHPIDVLTRGLEWRTMQGYIKAYGARLVACSCTDLASSILLCPVDSRIWYTCGPSAARSPDLELQLEVSVLDREHPATFALASCHNALMSHGARLPSS